LEGVYKGEKGGCWGGGGEGDWGGWRWDGGGDEAWGEVRGGGEEKEVTPSVRKERGRIVAGIERTLKKKKVAQARFSRRKEERGREEHLLRLVKRP